MTARFRQTIAPLILGGALLTSIAVVAPQLFAAQSVPAVAELPAAPLAAPETNLASDDGSVDMNHWQETGVTITPFTSGVIRKGGK